MGKLPKWAMEDLKKTGDDFWNSRFMHESLEKATLIMKVGFALLWMQELQSILVEVHGTEEGDRQFKLIMQDIFKSKLKP